MNKPTEMEERVRTGLRLAEMLEELLQAITKTHASVDPKDIDSLNKCHAPGNPDELEFSGRVEDSKAYKDLQTLCEDLRRNPATRSIIVDNEDSRFTEDSLWLSLPKWQSSLNLPSIYWHVVTQRTIESFQDGFRDGWRVVDASGHQGTAFVSKEGIASSKRHYGALFSDQPRMVAHHGLKIGSELWKVAMEKKLAPKLVIRLFRCAPCNSLIEGITQVVEQELTNNVFDVWIRHPEIPDKMLEGFGQYEHAVGNDSATLLQKLTCVIHPEEEEEKNKIVVSSEEPKSIFLSQDVDIGSLGEDHKTPADLLPPTHEQRMPAATAGPVQDTSDQGDNQKGYQSTTETEEEKSKIVVSSEEPKSIFLTGDVDIGSLREDPKTPEDLLPPTNEQRMSDTVEPGTSALRVDQKSLLLNQANEEEKKDCTSGSDDPNNFTEDTASINAAEIVSGGREEVKPHEQMTHLSGPSKDGNIEPAKKSGKSNADGSKNIQKKIPLPNDRQSTPLSEIAKEGNVAPAEKSGESNAVGSKAKQKLPLPKDRQITHPSEPEACKEDNVAPAEKSGESNAVGSSDKQKKLPLPNDKSSMCSACMSKKSNSEFSKAQLKKKKSRCQECVQNGRVGPDDSGP
jgi:hypothetical protein